MGRERIKELNQILNQICKQQQTIQEKLNKLYENLPKNFKDKLEADLQHRSRDAERAERAEIQLIFDKEDAEYKSFYYGTNTE